MSHKDHLDPQSQLFHHTWTRPKHLNSQVNGETQVTRSTLRARGNAKAYRMF